MSDNEMVRELATALEPVKDVCDRLMTLVEQLIARVEVLELEVLKSKASPKRFES